MATRLEKTDYTTPNLLFETDVSDWNDLAAEEYLSNLTRYLRNITISFSRPLVSDLTSVDSDDGLVWLIAIPVGYFFVVGLILGVLLLCLWYVDKDGRVSPSHSEASVSTAALSSVKSDTAMKSMKRDTVVVNEAYDSLHQSAFRSYLINPECQDILRVSDSSKGSTRSLGVLTEKDLQVVPKLSAPMKSPDVTPTGRKPPMGIQECSRHDMGCADRKFDSRTFTKVRPSFRTALTSDVRLNMINGSVSSRNDSSFSTDSLEGKVTVDCLRTNMEFHKSARAANEAIGPGDLYTCNRIIHDSNKQGIVEDTIINRKAESSTNRKFMFLNHVFTGKNMRDADAHLKETYEIALNADKLNFYYRTSDDHCSSSFFPSMHFPGNELSDDRRPEITPFRNAYTLNYDNSEVLSEIRPELSIKNTGTNCQKIHYGSYLTPSSNSKALNSNIKTRLFTSDCSVSDSQMSSAFFTEEDTQSSNNQQRCNYHSDIPLVSNALSDQPGSRHSSDCRKDNFQARHVEFPDFDLSSLSQAAMSSDFDNSRESPGSTAVTRDEGSFDSADNSLPSSIARFHASNIGQWPSPSAGYSLPSETDFESSRNECLCQDCLDKGISRSSLSVNIDSCSEPTAAETRAAMSQENNPSLSQNGTDCDQASCKLDQGLVKLSKRPSPLSSLVNIIRQRYSLDDNCLKSRREASEEGEALLSSPVLQKEFGSNYYKQHSFNSKGKKVSVEERLQEYGFLKYKGKRYVINPSPGKYETGAGYYNYVFTNSEEVCETPGYHQDHGNKQNCMSQVNFSLNGRKDGGRVDGDSECISKSQFSQCGERSVSVSQYSPFMEDPFYHFSQSRFNQRGEIPVTGAGFDTDQDSQAVFEAHCGDEWMFSDEDFKRAEGQVNQIAGDIPRDVSSLSDHEDVFTFEKEDIDQAKSTFGKTTFAGGFDSPEAARISHTGLVQATRQNGICEQIEAGAFEKNQNGTSQNGTYRKSQNGSYRTSQNGTYRNSQNGIYGESHNDTHEKLRYGTYTKSQNGTYGKSQYDTNVKSQNGSYRKHSNEMQETPQTYDNNNAEYYENARIGTNEKPQNEQYENTQQCVIKTLELAKKSCFPDISSLHLNSKNTTVTEDDCVSSMTSAGMAAVEPGHKLKRQFTSRALLSLENDVSEHCEIQQHRRNGRLSSSSLYRFITGNMQKVEATDSPRL